MKKDGGVVQNWFLHTLSDETRKKYNKVYPENIGKILTGDFLEEPTGRWKVGDFMRSSLVVSFDGMTVETLNTRYRVVGPAWENDMGDSVMGIYFT